MRKTKIICTIGPASDDPKIFAEMCKAGLNVARLNFSHGTHEDQQARINMIQSVREALNLPIAILLDTKGPEFRIKTFENKEIFLNNGDAFTFTTRDIQGNNAMVAVSYGRLNEELEKGDTILVNDGLVKFEVDRIEGTEIHCRTLIGGKLSDRKSMSFPGKVLKQVYLSERDKQDLLFGIKNGVNFVAASFVSCKQDVKDVRDFLDANGGEDIEIIAKIENQSGIDNIDEICEVCEGVMVARGDLGVEVNYVLLPSIQKKLITKCRSLGRIVVTATEMLESMIHEPRPTRAEITDVANAVYDGTSAIMLSGETTVGRYPVESVRTMSEIAYEAEQNIDYAARFLSTDFEIKNQLDAISHSVGAMAYDIKAKAIAVSSFTGTTIRMISRYMVPIDIVGIAIHKSVWYKLSLCWGVIPVMSGIKDSAEEMFHDALKIAEETLSLVQGDTVMMIGGDVTGKPGNTNLIKIGNIQ